MDVRTGSGDKYLSSLWRFLSVAFNSWFLIAPWVVPIDSFTLCQEHKVECPFPTGSHGLSVTFSPRCLVSSLLPDCPCALQEPSASSSLPPHPHASGFSLSAAKTQQHPHYVKGYTRPADEGGNHNACREKNFGRVEFSRGNLINLLMVKDCGK